VPIAYHKKPPVFSTVYDVIRLYRKAKKLHLQITFDMVHTRPGIPALIGLKMKKRFGIKFLNDIREFYADSRIDGGIWNSKSFLYKRIYHFFKQKENEAVEKSDGIVCLTYTAEKIIRQWAQYKKNMPLTVIPCSVDMNLFDREKVNTIQKSKFKNELNIQESDFIISYLGSVGSWYLIDEMIRFFKIISDKIPAAKFLFISPGEHEVITLTAHKHGLLANKIMVKQATRKDIPALLSFSKYSVFFIKPCYSKQSSSPTKHGEIMAMGIPVITNDGVGDVANIVEKYQSGIVLKELNEKEFNSVANIINEGTTFDEHNIRTGALEYYSLTNAIEKYKNIYKKIIG
jgi:glycosyltransferase involved in cell wall biosynthesis